MDMCNCIPNRLHIVFEYKVMKFKLFFNEVGLIVGRSVLYRSGNNLKSLYSEIFSKLVIQQYKILYLTDGCVLAARMSLVQPPKHEHCSVSYLYY